MIPRIALGAPAIASVAWAAPRAGRPAGRRPRRHPPPIAQEPVRSAEEIANEHRTLPESERAAAISLTVERFLAIFRRDNGDDVVMTVVLQGIEEAAAPQIVGVAYKTRDVALVEKPWFVTIS